MDFKRRFLFSLLCTLTLSFASTAHAQQSAWGDLTVSAARIDYDLSGTGSAPGLAVRTTRHLASHVLVEFGGVFARPDQQFGPSTLVMPEAQLQYRWRAGRVSPYIGGGIGAALAKSDFHSDWDPTLSVAVGTDVRLTIASASRRHPNDLCAAPLRRPEGRAGVIKAGRETPVPARAIPSVACCNSGAYSPVRRSRAALQSAPRTRLFPSCAAHEAGPTAAEARATDGVCASKKGATAMKRRTLLACCVLLVQALALAQPAQPSDPLSGNWGSDGAPNLELKVDGRMVSGTAIWRAGGQELQRTAIETGTFDAKTGAFRLEGPGRGPDGVQARYRIEGTVKGDTISGTFKFGEETGAFTFNRLAAAEGKRTPEEIEASFNAHKGDFDYLLGDWAFTADSKEFGKHGGFWSAVRLAEGQILDEYRVVGDNGETFHITSSLRNYNKMLDRWELVGADAGAGLQDFGTGRRVGTEMHIEQKFGVMSDRPSIWKIRYYNIQPDRFSWTADRSVDGGKTWEKNHLQIEARRLGPPRSLGPLAPARKGKS